MAPVLLAVVCGLCLLVMAGVSHRRDQDKVISDVLGMTREAPVALRDEEALNGVTNRAVDLAGQAVDRMDRERSLGILLERARIGLRPGEFVIIVAGGALGVAALLLLVSSSAPLAAAGGLGAVLLPALVLRRRVKKRRQAFEAQLPDALSLVASSLSAGHTFLRAIQMMCEESGPPLSEEFARLVAETRLGDPVVDALERTAMRLQIRDLDMVVQAIRIQQTVGGRLAELLHTLADVIRARGEVKREVMILTAEGRMSAYVLAGLVPFLFIVMHMLNPAYLQPMYRGWGLGVLIGCGVSVITGMLVILRMVKIDI